MYIIRKLITIFLFLNSNNLDKIQICFYLNCQKERKKKRIGLLEDANLIGKLEICINL